MSFAYPDYGQLRHEPLLERLRVLQSAFEIAWPLGFTPDLEDWIWQLVPFSRHDLAIVGRLHFVYLQHPIDFARRFQRNRDMEDSLAEFGALLDDNLAEFEPHQRLNVLIAALEVELGEEPGGSRVYAQTPCLTQLPAGLPAANRRAAEKQIEIQLHGNLLYGNYRSESHALDAARAETAYGYWLQRGYIYDGDGLCWSLQAVELPFVYLDIAIERMLGCLWLPDEMGEHPIVPELAKHTATAGGVA